MRRLLPALLLASLAIGGASAQSGPDATAAQREAEAARQRSELLEREAARATGAARRANAEAAAFAGRIEAAEAEITAAEARIRQIEVLRREQRARLAERQGSLIRLTAALQTMARRPPALALVQPGSLDDVVRVRALLASSLPAIRARTASVRAEVARGNALRLEADRAVARLRAGREDLRRRRIALARFEQGQRQRSQSLAESALLESDRALAFGEEARELTALAGTRQFQAQLARRLAGLPGPVLRPGERGAPAGPRRRYLLPVDGRLTTGTGEISDAGVHARGLVFATRAGAEVVAPRSGRVAYARAFPGYGLVVILDHGSGWTSTLTHLSSADVREGGSVRQGEGVGRASATLGVELRLNARPVPIAPFL
jgi:murein hydrolase activator